MSNSNSGFRKRGFAESHKSNEIKMMKPMNQPVRVSKCVKTYGVFGLMEYIARIPAGSIDMEVHFSGGQLSGYGVCPALYSTSDPVRQSWIERSDDFLSGKIRLISSTEGE